MNALAVSLAASLVLTVVLELSFLAALGVRERKDLALVVLVNVLTNPAVVLLHFLAVYRAGWNRVPVTIVLEAAAVLVEAHYYRRCGKAIHRPLLCALSANLFSYTMGFIINFLIGRL